MNEKVTDNIIKNIKIEWDKMLAAQNHYPIYSLLHNLINDKSQSQYVGDQTLCSTFKPLGAEFPSPVTFFFQCVGKICCVNQFYLGKDLKNYRDHHQNIVHTKNFADIVFYCRNYWSFFSFFYFRRTQLSFYEHIIQGISEMSADKLDIYRQNHIYDQLLEFCQ